MKSLKLLLAVLFSGIFFTSCELIVDDGIPLEEVVSGYDLWYVDYHRTTGNGDIPFFAKAFTVSFLNGNMYANNNIADIGRTGTGLGIRVGNYNTFNGVLETNHNLDGAYDFNVVQLSVNEIRIDDLNSNLSYYLIGYQTRNFDYDKLFYENIEYFLQEYVAWKKVSTNGGVANVFDDENYLQFTPENNTTFYSSHDVLGTNIDNINWDFVGSYEVYDVLNYNDLKILTLNYDNGDTEEFELSVINDQKIRLYHVNSETVYDYSGRGFIQYLKNTKEKLKAKNLVRNNNRKRTKIKRETKVRKHLK